VGLVSGADRARNALDLGTDADEPPDVDVAIVRHGGDHVLSGKKLEVDDFECMPTQERLLLSGPMDDAHHATCQASAWLWGRGSPACAVAGAHAPRIA
jgi:hypothetical protein